MARSQRMQVLPPMEPFHEPTTTLEVRLLEVKTQVTFRSYKRRGTGDNRCYRCENMVENEKL